MAFHIGPNGPGDCNANHGRCPYGSAEEHFETQEEAAKAFEERMTSSAKIKLTKRAKYPLSPEEKALRRQNWEAAKSLVETRAAAGDVIYDDANLQRAERRLKESIEYAKSRENTHLVDKLSRATVLPSGSFRTPEGKRVNTDAVLKIYVATKAIEKARDEALKNLSARLTDEPVGTKFTHKDSSGSYSLTVVETMNDEEFDELPENVRIAISTEKESIDAELAKEKLSKDEYLALTNETQVIDYVIGKAPSHEVPALSLREESEKGKKAGLQEGLEDIARFYADTHASVGKVKDLKSSLAESSDAIKATAAKREGNTFAPARSQYNGAVVGVRRSIDSKKASELLSPEKLASIKKISYVPDREKAETILPEKDFDRIFRARKLSLRVLEAKG